MLENKVLETIKKYNMIEYGDKIVVRGIWWTRFHDSSSYFTKTQRKI